MEKSIKQAKKSYFNERYGVDFSRFFTLVKMLLQDKLKFSLKANKKETIIKLVSLLIGFILLTAVSYVFYMVAELLNIFSVLKYVPLTVPSIISSILFILGFLSVILGLNRTLFYSQDNRLMITYPCNGNTIFLARMFVYFINEYIRNFVIQIPLFLGYMLIMSFPIGMIFWAAFGLIFITLAEVLLGVVFSIPVYYVSKFLNARTILKIIVYGTILILIISAIGYLVFIIPEEIDIFTNWGPYFTRIQDFLNGYQEITFPLYSLTIFLTGNLVGFRIIGYSLTTLYVLLTLLAVIIICFVISIIFINPLYFKLASESFEFENDSTFASKKTTKRNFTNTQFHKELLLFSKDPSLIVSLLGTFIFLPIVITLLNKVFGAMNVNSLGNQIVQVVNFLIISLIALNANSVVANSYSLEGTAFQYNRVYPKKSYFILLSKNIIPFMVGAISIMVSCIIFGALKSISTGEIILLIFSLFFVYLGHILFASQLDFCNTTSQFQTKNTLSKAQITTTIMAFVIPLLFSVLFFLYLSNGRFSAYIKLLILSIMFLAINIWVYYYRVKLIYKEGN